MPYRRLQRSEIAKTFGSGGGKGTRSVASLRRGHHDDGRRGGPARARAVQPTASRPTRCGSRPPTPRTSTRPTRRRSTPRCGSTPTCPRSTSAARCVRRSARCARRSTAPAPRSSSPPTCAPVCRRAATKPASGDGAGACSSATTHDGAGHRRVPRRRRARPRSSSSAGARPVDPLERVGGALRRDRSTCRSSSRRGTRR